MRIPSDLLSFDEAAGDLRPLERLDAVKSHVLAMKEMIQVEKETELEAARGWKRLCILSHVAPRASRALSSPAPFRPRTWVAQRCFEVVPRAE